jgi:hypothetical protein
MCAVAGRALYRGLTSDDLAAFGIGFGLFEMPALAALSAQVIAEEQALRRPVSVTITSGPSSEDGSADGPATPERVIRFVPAPVGA